MRDVSDEFASLMLYMGEAYGVRLSEQRIRIYAQDLSDLSIEQVKEAMAGARRECKYFPTIAEIRLNALPTIDEAALIAWSGFERAAGQVGAWSPLVVDDVPAAEALTAVFGSWPAYCDSERIAIATRRQEFVAAYRNHRRYNRKPGPVVLHGLTGGCQAQGGWVGHMLKAGPIEHLIDTGQYRGLDGNANARPALREAGEALEVEGPKEAHRIEGHRDS